MASESALLFVKFHKTKQQQGTVLICKNSLSDYFVLLQFRSASLEMAI